MYGTWIKIEPTNYAGDLTNMPVGTEVFANGSRSSDKGDVIIVDTRTYRSLQIKEDYLRKHWRKKGDETRLLPQFRASADPVFLLPPSVERGLRETDCGVHDFL